MSQYDAAATRFELHRMLPSEAPAAIRAAVLDAIGPPRPRLLDLGAGTGRIGRAFVSARDEYLGVDLSSGMLYEFAQQAAQEDAVPILVCADGQRLPVQDSLFDGVMMMQVLGAARNWRPLVNEALRVLRSPGTLIIGHTDMPADGLDARMKQRLASLLDDMAVAPYHTNARDEVRHWLESIAQSSARVTAAEWETARTPRAFLDRQPSGAQFSRLPQPIKDEALRKLAAWAIATFGSLDTVFRERHSFELQVFKFQHE
jgi:ubiquinone/menaquinone biosynthesis C-methylase UbiE